MDLDKFLENDIEEFLDSQMSKKEKVTQNIVRAEEADAFTLTKDYSKEVRKALEKDLLPAAVRVFMELKEEYKTLPSGNERIKAYDIMVEIYNQVNTYMKNNPQYRNISPEQEGLLLPASPVKTYEERRGEQIEALKASTAKKDESVAEVRKSLDRVEKLLERKDYLAATVMYKNAKASFGRIPNRFEKEKASLYDELLTSFYLIKKELGKAHSEGRITEDEVEELMPSHKEELHEPVKKSESAEPVGYESGVAKEDIISRIEDVKRLIREKDARGALKGYRELRGMFSRFHAPHDVKEQVFRDILALYNSAGELEKHLVSKNLRARPEKPLIKKVEKPDLLRKIRQGKLKAYKYLEHGQTSSAVHEYNALKKLFGQVPDTMKDEKTRLYTELVEIHERIKSSGSEGKKADVAQKINLLLDANRIQDANRIFLDLQHKAALETDEGVKRRMFSDIDKVKNRLSVALSVPKTERV